MEHLRHHAALFHDAAVRRKIAVQHGKAAVGVERLASRVDDLRVDPAAEADEELAHRAARRQTRVGVKIALDGLHRRAHAAGLVIIVHIEFRGRLELRDAGHVALDRVKGREVHRNTHHARERADVELGVRRAAGRGDVAQAVLEARLGDDVGKAHALLRERDDALADVARLLVLGGRAEEHGRAVDGAKADDLGEYAHGVGGAVHRAGAAGETDILTEAGKGLLADGVDVALTDGFLEVGRDVGTLVRLVGQHTARREEHTGLIERRGGHEHTGHDLVAGAQEHQTVEAVSARHRLNAAGDQVARWQDEVHPLALRHAVAGGGNVELRRRTAGRPHALLDVAHQLLEGAVPRVDVRKGIDDADDGLFQVLCAVAAGVHQADVIALLRVRGGAVSLPAFHRVFLRSSYRLSPL